MADMPDLYKVYRKDYPALEEFGPFAHMEINIFEDGTTNTRISAFGHNPRELLERVIKALQSELADVDKCPYHK